MQYIAPVYCNIAHQYYHLFIQKKTKMGSACCRSEEKATPTEKNLKKITEHVTFDKFIKAFDEHAARGDKFVVYLTAAIDGRDM